MAGPFIFIATNRLKPGKVDAERERVPGLVDFIQTNEPRVIAFTSTPARTAWKSRSSRSTRTLTRWHCIWR